jgi:hypothetical protein
VAEGKFDDKKGESESETDKENVGNHFLYYHGRILARREGKTDVKCGKTGWVSLEG